MPVVPGMAMKEGAGDGPFPYDTATTVVNWAHKAGRQDVIDKVYELIDWLGNPDRVVQLSETWSPDASSKVVASYNDLDAACGDLSAYWKGPAFDAFNKYILSLKEVGKQTSEIMDEIRGKVVELRTEISNTYKAAIEALSTCASGLLEAAGSMAQNWYSLWGAVSGAILDALAVFAETIGKLASSAVEIVDGITTKISALVGQVALLSVPGRPPNALSDVGGWDVRPST